MAKILLVEDDTNLREIYGARLEAEGYQILSANDGEAALALAVQEQPELVISDVMMPKISGFDMLDILRSTPETKNVKVIVMTALGQDEDKKRGEELGADRYIVKSQVTLDDVVQIVHEVMGDSAAPQQAPVASPMDPQIAQTPTDTPAQATPTPIQPPTGDPSSTTVATAVPVSTPPRDPVAPSQNTSTPQPSQPDPVQATQPEPNLNDQVADFVATSPLMNGTAPTMQPPIVPSVNEPTDQQEVEPEQTPPQAPPVA